MICKYFILFLFIYPAFHKLVVLSSSVVAGDNIYGYLFNITSSLITINWFILNILLLVSIVNNKMNNHNIVYSKYFNNITTPRCYYTYSCYYLIKMMMMTTNTRIDRFLVLLLLLLLLLSLLGYIHTSITNNITIASATTEEETRPDNRITMPL